MADIIRRQSSPIPSTMQTRYRDMLDGTHAEVISALIAGGAVDITDRANRDLGVVRVSVIGTGGNVIGSVRIVGQLPAGIETIGQVRTLNSYDGTNWVEGRLDASTYARETIDYAHHEIHAGSSFHCHYNQLVSDINDRSIISFRTPETTKYLHISGSASVSGFALVRVLEGPTITDNTGAPLAVYNRNRNNATTSGVWDTSQNPDVQGQATYFTEVTMGAVTGGTAITSEYLASGAKNFASGGARRGVSEWMLLPNMLYAVDITSLTNDDNYCSISLDWYEHTDKS